MTTTLLTARPSKFWRMQSPGGDEHWVVMYNVPDGRCEQLPIGKRFAQVTSPSSYQSEPRWSLTQFEVRLRLWAGHDADGNKVEREGRAYTQINQRVLTAEEIAHLKRLIENYRKEQEMPRRNYPKLRRGKRRPGQRSKRARAARKRAIQLGLHPLTGHPSHISWRKNRNAHFVYKNRKWKARTDGNG